MFKSLKWRDRCHTESEVKIDKQSNVWLGEDSQRDKAKWQRYHGSVAALCTENHVVERSRCGNGVTLADCDALYKRSFDRFLGGMMWRDAGLEGDRGDDAAWKLE